MKTIKENQQYEFVLKKSRFIALLYKVQTTEEVNQIIEECKLKWKDATHYCYAYRIDSKEKMSDDKEPSGTAGMPILNVLRKKDVNHVLCIVIRYFNGIKLGSGGLIRAYSKACREVLEKTNMIELKKGYEIEFTFPYENQKQVDFILEDAFILKKDWQEKTTYLLHMDVDTFHILCKQLESLGTITIHKEIFL